MSAPFRNLEAARTSGERIDFSFGENWGKFLGTLTDERIREAEASLRRSFADVDFTGRRFIDVGCGSGLFSLCARRLGAASVVSIDIDPASIACVTRLKEREGAGPEWTVCRGSVLDRDFLATVAPAPLVYSWGVLHHTGDMWRAVENAFTLVAPGGLFCLALYNRPWMPRVQLGLKRAYNRLPRAARPALVAAYSGVWLAAVAATGRSPIRYLRDYARRERGMSFWRDVEDWLGGLPFEWTTADKVTPFAAARGFSVEAVRRRRPGANDEYLLRRVGSQA